MRNDGDLARAMAELDAEMQSRGETEDPDRDSTEAPSALAGMLAALVFAGAPARR